MKLSDPVHINRLSRAIQASYESLSWGRRSKAELVSEFAGPRYGNDGLYAKPETYVNLIQIAINAYQVSLAYNEPRVLVTAKTSEHRHFAERFQVALNNYAKTIHMGETIREIIRDAVFLVGIGKSHLADAPEVLHEIDVFMDPGKPHFSRVSFDNWVHDVSKSDFRRAQFFGDRFQMDLDVAKECPYYKKSLREKLTATTMRDRAESWGEFSSFRDGTEEEIVDTIDLINIYLPKERKICTFSLKRDFEIADDEPLCTIDWDGPETGCYRFLSFIDIPDNIMPTSPAQTLSPLAYLYNYLMRKIARRSKQQKDVIHYEPGDDRDVVNSISADDMATVKVSHIKGINIMRYPGPDQGLVSFTYGLQEIFKQAAGNIDAMVGLAPTAATLGQSQMIDQKVGVAIAGARSRVNRFVGETFTDLGWLLFDDPVQTIPGEREVPGTDIKIDASWNPPDVMERPAPFDHFSIEIEPYSMEYKSPAERLAAIQQDLQLIGPMIPLAQQVGLEFQFQEVINDISDLRGEPRYKKWFRPVPPPPQQPGQPGQPGQESPPGMAMRPPGTGQYTRTNVSEKTGDGQLQALMQQQPQQEQPVGMAG